LFCRKIQTRLLVATTFVSYIQTWFPLTTTFVSLLLGHRNSSPLSCPLFFPFALLLLLLLPRVRSASSSSLSALSSSLVVPLSLPRHSTNLSPVSLSLSPQFCFCGQRCFRSHHHHHSDPHRDVSLSLFDIFFLYCRDAHHRWRLSLSLPLSNFFSVWLDSIFSGLYHCCVDSSTP